MTEERRGHPRLKLRVPVELRTEGSEAPLRLETTDISLGGFYIEMMLEKVVTRDTSVGNGIQLTTMLPEDRERLKRFLIVAEVKLKTSTEQ